MNPGPADESEFLPELTGRTDRSHFAAVYGGEPASRIVTESEYFAAFVDLAPLVAGHLLIVPRTNVPSFAAMPPEAWPDWERLRERLMLALAERWTSPAILEHGSTHQMEGGACITHAHLHVVPLDGDILAEMREDGLSFQRVADQRDVIAEKERPYLYYERAEEAWFTWADDRQIPRQYIRRVVSRMLGQTADAWDWGVVVQRELLRQTVRELRPLLDAHV